MNDACRAAETFMLRHDELNADEEARLMAHIHTCPECRERLDAITTLGSRFMSETTALLPDDLIDRIMVPISRETSTALVDPDWRRSARILGILVLALGTSALFLRSSMLESLTQVAQVVLETGRAFLPAFSEIVSEITELGDIAVSWEDQLKGMMAEQNVVGAVIVAIGLAGLVFRRTAEGRRRFPCVTRQSH